MVETKLRQKRLEKGLSQVKLGYLAKVPSVVISDCECGRRLPWRRAREALATALGCRVSEIFPDGHKDGK